jgi:hypothetical protein
VLTAFFLIVTWIVVVETARVCHATLKGHRFPSSSETPYVRTELLES